MHVWSTQEPDEPYLSFEFLMLNADLFKIEYFHVLVGVGIGVSPDPLHRSQRAELPHWAPTSGVWRQSAR